MRISRVHVGAELVVGANIAFDQAQQHYLKHVLRLKTGAAVHLFNGRDGRDYRASLQFDKRHAGAIIETAIPVETESSLDSEVIQGLARTDHIDWMVQKTTELGVDRILIFNAGRSQKPLRAERVDKKLAHWRGVAIRACEQCGRARLPSIEFHPDLGTALGQTGDGVRWVLDANGIPLARQFEGKLTALSLLVGPEGGLDQEEIAAAQAAGFQPAGLGPRVLRTETAAAAALAIAQAMLGDLG